MTARKEKVYHGYFLHESRTLQVSLWKFSWLQFDCMEAIKEKTLRNYVPQKRKKGKHNTELCAAKKEKRKTQYGTMCRKKGKKENTIRNYVPQKI